MPSLRYRPLSGASELSDFYCNVDVMDSFIHDGLEDELREKNCEAFVVLDDDDSIIGFFAICEDDLELSPEDKDEMMSGISIAKTPRFSTMQDKTQFAIQNMFAAKEIAYLQAAQRYRHGNTELDKEYDGARCTGSLFSDS